MADEKEVARRFALLAPEMNERMRRLLAAAESLTSGYGGVSVVSRATGVSRRAIGAGIEELKQKIFDTLGLIRVFTKEPGRKHSELPVVMKIGADIRELAGRIRKDYPDRFVFAKIWGKSAKFAGQSVGIEYKLNDQDIVELHLK